MFLTTESRRGTTAMSTSHWGPGVPVPPITPSLLLESAAPITPTLFSKSAVATEKPAQHWPQSTPLSSEVSLAAGCNGPGYDNPPHGGLMPHESQGESQPVLGPIL